MVWQKIQNKTKTKTKHAQPVQCSYSIARLTSPWWNSCDIAFDELSWLTCCWVIWFPFMYVLVLRKKLFNENVEIFSIGGGGGGGGGGGFNGNRYMLGRVNLCQTGQICTELYISCRNRQLCIQRVLYYCFMTQAWATCEDSSFRFDDNNIMLYNIASILLESIYMYILIFFCNKVRSLIYVTTNPKT